jgi:hypothetical protein
MQHVRTITQQCCAINPSIRTNVSSLSHNLFQRLSALEQYEKTLDLSSQPQDENCTDISEVCPVPAFLAQQLTHVELERLSFIGPEEFVQAFAKENPHLETSFKDMKKTHNLEQYVQWFNRLSYFVATQVCKVSIAKKNYRPNMTSRFVVSKEKTKSSRGRILDRNGARMLQHRKFQQFNGNYSRFKHVSYFKTEENSKSDTSHLLALRFTNFLNFCSGTRFILENLPS